MYSLIFEKINDNPMLRKAIHNVDIILFLVFSTIYATGIKADSIERLNSSNDLSYGFATYLGTGIYKAGEQDVQVYQLPFSYSLMDEENDHPELKLTLPVTVGFFNIDTQDIIGGDFPDSVSTLSIVPGVTAGFQFTERWKFSPFIDFGFASDNESGKISNIYATGFRSRFEITKSPLTIVLGNNLIYATQTVDDGNDLDFSTLETGLDFVLPDFNVFDYHLANFNIYYVNFRYFDNLEFLRPAEHPVEVVIQNEIGFTFGIKLFQNYRYVDIPRIGLGYRKGDGLAAYRLVLGVPF